MKKAAPKHLERTSSLQHLSEEKSEKQMPREAQEEKVKSMLIFTKHYQVTFMAALTTVVFAGVMGYAGAQMDLWLETGRLCMIIGLLLSLPVSQIVLYKWIKKSYIPRIKKLS